MLQVWSFKRSFSRSNIHTHCQKVYHRKKIVHCGFMPDKDIISKLVAVNSPIFRKTEVKKNKENFRKGKKFKMIFMHTMMIPPLTLNPSSLWPAFLYVNFDIIDHDTMNVWGLFSLSDKMAIIGMHANMPISRNNFGVVTFKNQLRYID